jgi:ABC-2 type transport system ATP-binding protein
MAHTTAIIQTQNLHHYYGDFLAIRDVNLEVYQGEIFGFLGPNGAGKTTTIRTLLDFIRPSRGSAKVFGLDSRQDSLAIRGRVGYLPSELTLWDNWTGVQYIGWLGQARGGMNLLPEAENLAAKMDFDLKRPLSGMSTGMKRKMGLIAALAHKPELLILDEPTIGLDPLMQQAFYELMLAAKAEGRTVFLSSHNLPEVEHICDRVGIIREGEMKKVETVQNLVNLSFRWLTIELEGPAQPNGFQTLRGISDVSLEGSKLRMRVSGGADMNGLLQVAAQHQVRDLNLEHPSLEEIFLAFYE